MTRKRSAATTTLVVFSSVAVASSSVAAAFAPSRTRTTTTTPLLSIIMNPSSSDNQRGRPMSFSRNDMEEPEPDEVFSYQRRGQDDNADFDYSSEQDHLLDDLTPPTLNLARDSILFSDNPSTAKSSNLQALKLWQSCKATLPPVITGAWPWRVASSTADQNPIGALYNIAFVRLPVIAVAVIYVKNVLQGHPLIMDIGDGPFEMSPVVVLTILALILA